MTTHIDHMISGSAFIAAVTTVIGWLPSLIGCLASLAGLIWYVICICDSDWVKSRWGKRSDDHL